MKNKRRIDEQDDDFVNVLRQRFKQDEEQKQINVQQTFEILMNSQRQQQQQEKQLDRQQEPSYILFNNPNPYKTSQQEDNILSCYRCNRGTVHGKCGFCEHGICSDCAHICNICENVYCGGCSTIDYSSSFEKVSCLTCKSG